MSKHLFSNKGVLKCEETSSLKSLCAVNIVANLWINEKRELQKLIYEGREDSEIENIILTKIKQLCLPKTISGQLATVIEFVKRALKLWIEFHDKYLFQYFHNWKSNSRRARAHLSIKYLHLIKFTNNGMIDQMQTAKNIIAKESDPHLKYKLASQYCLEEIFKNIPSRVKKDFFRRFVENDLDPLKESMLFYWTYHNMNGNRKLYELIITRNDNDKSFNECIMDAVLDSDYPYEPLHFEVSIMFLWSKLTDTEKLKKVGAVIEKLENPALQYSVISSFHYRQQHMIFKEISFNFLRTILYDLIWRDYFVSIICHVFDWLDQDVYYDLLMKLTDEISYHLSENDKFSNGQLYVEILKSLWERTPYPFKEFVFQLKSGEGMMDLLSGLITVVNFDLMQMLLAGMPEIYKKKAIYSSTGLNYCMRFMKNEEWESLDLIFESFLVSDENQIAFKEHLILKSVMEVCIHHLQQDNWYHKINFFLNWAFKSDDKIADFKKSIRIITRNNHCYDIYYSQNAANKYSWIYPSQESLKNFQKFFLSKSINIQ